MAAWGTCGRVVRSLSGSPACADESAFCPYAARHNPGMAGTPHDLLDELTSVDRRVRERAAAYLGDWLAAAARASQNVDPVVEHVTDLLQASSWQSPPPESGGRSRPWH
jgi:hypothetical protein